MCKTIAWVERDRPLKHFESLLIRVLCVASKVGQSAQEAIVRSEAGRWLSERLLKPRILNSPGQGRHDRLRNVILHLEDVVETAVVAFSPKMRAGHRLD